MGSVYFNQGLYSKAMECFAKALQIQQQFLDENNPDLATTYNNIGNVFFTQKNMTRRCNIISKPSTSGANATAPTAMRPHTPSKT